MFDNGSRNNNGYSNGYSNGFSYSYSNGHGNCNTTTGSIITSSTKELFTTQRTYHQQFTAASRLQSATPATPATAARTSHY